MSFNQSNELKACRAMTKGIRRTEAENCQRARLNVVLKLARSQWKTPVPCHTKKKRTEREKRKRCHPRFALLLSSVLPPQREKRTRKTFHFCCCCFTNNNKKMEGDCRGCCKGVSEGVSCGGWGVGSSPLCFDPLNVH